MRGSHKDGSWAQIFLFMTFFSKSAIYFLRQIVDKLSSFIALICFLIAATIGQFPAAN